MRQNNKIMEYKTYLENKNFSQSSIKSHLYTTNRFTEWLQKQKLTISELTYNDITTYINHLQAKGNKQRTIQITIGKLKHYLNYHQSTGNLHQNPIGQMKIQGVKRQNLYNILTPEELDYIYQSYPSDCVPSIRKNYNLQNHPTNSSLRRCIESIEMEDVQRTDGIIQRNKVILSLLIYQGITTTDLGNLKLEHIKLFEGKIEIPETKKSNPRTLKLEPFQVLLFQSYMLTAREQILKDAQKETDNFIVSTGASNKILNLLQKLMNQIKKNIPKVKNTKQIRASVITKWLKQHNLRETQYRAGHRFVSSTEQYKINDIETLQNDIVQFSPNL